MEVQQSRLNEWDLGRANCAKLAKGFLPVSALTDAYGCSESAVIGAKNCVPSCALCRERAGHRNVCNKIRTEKGIRTDGPGASGIRFNE